VLENGLVEFDGNTEEALAVYKTNVNW
jgi:hypothetical protein